MSTHADWKLKWSHEARKRARKRARALGLPFELKASDVKWVDTCPVFGCPLKIGECMHPSDDSPSLDRIRPELGYVPGNVIVVSMRANRIKNNATHEELLRVAEFYKAIDVT